MDMKLEIERIISCIDFTESSLIQLKKDLLNYLLIKSENTKQTTELSKMLRNIAATEQNPQLQQSLFESANVYTELNQLLSKYAECELQSRTLIEEFNKYLVVPMREIVSDSTQSLTSKTAKNNIEGNLELEQRIEHTELVLPFHSRLFERHRVRYMKTILHNMLLTELSYHCLAVEKITPLLESLSNIEDVSVLDEMIPHS